MRVLTVLPLLLVAFAGCASTPDVPDAPVTGAPFALALVAGGLQQPVALVPVPGLADAFLVAQQDGLVRVLDGDLRVVPLLDVSDLTRSNGEQGLLGIALAPDFPASGLFYVHHSDLHGDSVLARYRADPSTLTTDPATRQVLLHVEQPYANHNGGQLVFGPDGMLYMGLGDGGLAGDPEGNGQDPGTLLGSIIRLNVSPDGAPSHYRIPRSNPFVDGGGAQEVYIYGLRNPWRFSFDRQTGDLWIADVGQDHVEEVNLLPKGEQAGRNLGWNWFEGTHRFRTSGSPPAQVVAPVAEYDHDGGHCSVTGGFRYRGTAVEDLAGAYVFGDYCSGTIWTLTSSGAGAGSSWSMQQVMDTDMRISAFGEDNDGELYVVDHGGRIHRIVAT